ncbi:MAG: T9SS type A sorting domain-containing protein [Bacteroidetes bacterium]|nr:T9SS type A sorting domain-containing protein [Bacteroidota bacterium]
MKNRSTKTAIHSFPNPSNKSISFSISGINIEAKSNLLVKIVTMEGKFCYQNRCSPESQIDISFLSNGIYFIFVEMEDGTLFKEKL